MSVESKVPLCGGGISYADLDNDETLSADSDTRIPSQQAVKGYVDAQTATATNLTKDYGSIAHAYIDFNGAGEAGMLITLAGIEYQEADTADAANGVWTNGTSAAESAASLIAAINGDTRTAVPYTAVADSSGDGVWVFADAAGSAYNATITTDSASNCTVENLMMGEDPKTLKVFSHVHTVGTQELLSGEVQIPTPFAPDMVQITAYDSDGAILAYTDQVTIGTEPDRIIITITGAAPLIDGNIMHVFCTD